MSITNSNKRVLNILKSYFIKNAKSSEDAASDSIIVLVDIWNKVNLPLFINIKFNVGNKNIFFAPLDKESYIMCLDTKNPILDTGKELEYNICDALHTSLYWGRGNQDKIKKSMKNLGDWNEEYEKSPSGNDFQKMIVKTKYYKEILKRINDIINKESYMILRDGIFTEVSGYRKFSPIFKADFANDLLFYWSGDFGSKFEDGLHRMSLSDFVLGDLNPRIRKAYVPLGLLNFESKSKYFRGSR